MKIMGTVWRISIYNFKFHGFLTENGIQEAHIRSDKEMPSIATVIMVSQPKERAVNRIVENGRWMDFDQ